MGPGGRQRLSSRLVGGHRQAARRGRTAGRSGPWRLREQPRDEARPALPDGAAGDRHGPGGGASGRSRRTGPGGRRSPRSRSLRPASSICACATSLSRQRLPTSWPTHRTGVASARSPARSVNVEFVSANPTGPLHVGNARGAFIGDLLSRVLEAGGQRVTREYYFNDSGGQIRNLGASVAALRRGEAVPDDGYHGDYVVDLATRDARRHLGRGAARPAPNGRHHRPVGGRPGPRGDRGEPRRPRRPVRCLDERGAAARRGLGRPRGRPAARARSRLRGGRRGLVPLDRRSATTRTGSSIARTASRPTSPPTSATSPRSSAAASTTSSTSGAPTTTGRSPACATPPRRWATTATPSRSSSTRGSASSATARRSR